MQLMTALGFKVVDSCQIFSTKWSDVSLYMERSKDLEKSIS